MTAPLKVLLVIIDTLRADHLGCYGYRRATSPILDELAACSIRFSHAFSACSYTLPSIASILTSKYPFNHGVGFSQAGSLDMDIDITIAEMLKHEGYATGGFVSSLVLRNGSNFPSGFDVYDAMMTSHELNRNSQLIRDGNETTDRAIEWITKHKDKNFFAFVHYFDVHGPYVCPELYAGLFTNDEFDDPITEKSVVPDSEPYGGIPAYQVLLPQRGEADQLTGYEKRIGYYISQYDGGIRYCDSILARLIQNLKELHIYDDTLIIITSDHGEALGENDVYFYHGLTVTPDQIHVPLIIKPPQSLNAIQRVITDHVSTIDIMPTILSMAGVNCADLSLDGLSLTGLIRGSNDAEIQQRQLYSETEGQKAVISPDGIVTLSKKAVLPNPSVPIIPDLMDVLDGRSLYLCSHFDEPEGVMGSIFLIPDKEHDRRFCQLQRRVRHMETQIKEYGVRICLQENNVRSTERLVKEGDAKIAELERTISDKDAQISDLSIQLQKKNAMMESINQSIVWRSVQSLQVLIDRIMPHRTTRRITYDRCLKFLHITVNKGPYASLAAFSMFLQSRIRP